MSKIVAINYSYSRDDWKSICQIVHVVEACPAHGLGPCLEVLMIFLNQPLISSNFLKCNDPAAQAFNSE